MSRDHKDPACLAYDIGSRNLAFCLLSVNMDTGKFSIHRWGIFDLKENGSSTIQQITIELYKKLYNTLWPLDDYDIVIEQQPTSLRATTMKCISHAIQMFYLVEQREITFQSGLSKLKAYTGPCPDICPTPKSKYLLNKQTAIVHTDCILKQQGQQNWLQTFHAQRKKDDLADAFLHAAYYLQRRFKPPTYSEIRPITQKRTTESFDFITERISKKPKKTQCPPEDVHNDVCPTEQT